MNLITTTDALRAFCDPLHALDYVTVDTEFMREKTYWPELCLVQVAGPDSAAAIDALADGIDLGPLYDLLDDTNVLKVFHAGRQDMEIFLHLTDRLPTPLFDTQIAAMVCGFGDSAGYETLVNKLARQSIDKSSRFTDWSLRPLSDKQITYAISDVTHLRVVYEKLVENLARNGRESWVAAEMEGLADPATYVVQPDEAYQRIKIRNPSPKVLAVLREAAAWREREAQRADVPRNRILRDESLTEIAHHPPKSPKDLARIRGLSSKMADGWQGKQILEGVAKAMAMPEDERPQPPEKRALPRGIGPAADLLKVLLKLKAEESDVAQRLIASAADVELIAAFGEDAGVPALRGWRRALFGEEALRLRKGDLAIAMSGKRLVLVEQGGVTNND